jgi:hypothetical protein
MVEVEDLPGPMVVRIVGMALLTVLAVGILTVAIVPIGQLVAYTIAVAILSVVFVEWFRES